MNSTLTVRVIPKYTSYGILITAAALNAVLEIIVGSALCLECHLLRFFIV